MDSILTIDQGNTCCKVAVFADAKPVLSRRFEAVSIEDVLPIMEEYGVAGAIYASVARHDVRLIETLRNLLDDNVIVLGHTTPVPLTIHYDSGSSLGLDRIAAAAGALALYPDKTTLVVDAGTAVTLDLVNADTGFIGGRISPGLALRFRALHEFTDRLPNVNPHGATPLFANSTEESIRSGVVCGMVAEIADAWRKAHKNHGCDNVVLTGGDADFIYSLLSDSHSATDTAHNKLSQNSAIDLIPLAVCPNLVAYGLYSIYKYNENL